MPHLRINKSSSLHYKLIRGDTRRPYLVFLHEGLGCTAMWGDFPKRLCKASGCPGLVYDRLGYGKSSPLSQTRTIHYLHVYALRELPQVLEKVIPETPYILIGHSDGGSISLIFGAERPTFLRAIITEAAHVFVEPQTLSGIKTANAAWTRGKLKGLTKYHGDKTESIFQAWAKTWLATWFKYWNIEYLLPSIEVPMLVIQGINDQYGSLDQVNSIASKSSGDVRREIVEDCAHIPHHEAQPVVLELMSGFIRKTTVRKAPENTVNM